MDNASIFIVLLHCPSLFLVLFFKIYYQDRGKMVHVVLFIPMGTTSEIETIEIISSNLWHALLQPSSKTNHLSRREPEKI